MLIIIIIIMKIIHKVQNKSITFTLQLQEKMLKSANITNIQICLYAKDLSLPAKTGINRQKYMHGVANIHSVKI